MTSDPEVPDTTRAFERLTPLGFFPADHAAVESGKVYASGAYWNTLRFPAFPAILPGAALVAVLLQPFHASHSDHEFEMNLVDADEVRLPMKVQGQFRAAPGPESRFGEAGVIAIAVPIYGLSFERPGDYAFVLHVDGAELTRFSIHVLQVFGIGMMSQIAPAS